MTGARRGLAIVLLAALALRLGPILCERQTGRDVIENRNLGENLRAGRLFTLDINSHADAPSPAMHYGGREQPVLLPVLWVPARWVLPPAAAAQWLGPILFLIALALVHLTLRREIGPGVAFSATLLLALNPFLFDLSLSPVAATAALPAGALILWAWWRQRSAPLTGLACWLGFLAHPAMLAAPAVLLIFFLIEAVRSRRTRRLGLFVAFAAIGPLWLGVFNRMMGAPPLTLPGAGLLHVLDAADGVQYLHHGGVFESAADVVRTHTGARSRGASGSMP